MADKPTLELKSNMDALIRAAKSNPDYKWLWDILVLHGFIDPERTQQHQVAEAWGVTAQAVRNWVVRDGCPRHYDQTYKNFYNLREIITWREGDKFGDGTPLAGEKSPAIEKLRSEQALMARMRRLKMEEHLVERSVVHNLMTSISSVLRSTGESLGKIYGADAQKMMNEAIESFRKEADKLKPKGESHEKKSKKSNRGGSKKK
jgi:phage terminase Nu1 subunit (DNA packaging protein)